MSEKFNWVNAGVMGSREIADTLQTLTAEALKLVSERENNFLLGCVERYCPPVILRAALNPVTGNVAAQWLKKNGFSLQRWVNGRLDFCEHGVPICSLLPMRFTVPPNSPLTP